jgi:hypothetical protein
MSNDMNCEDDESNGGDNNYSAIWSAIDAEHIEVGDTVWVEVSATAERDDPEEMDWAPELYDDYEVTVTDVTTNDRVVGGQSVTVTVDNGDEITVSGDGLWLTRGYEDYWSRDYNNSVRIALKNDEEQSDESDDEDNDESEVATDDGVDFHDDIQTTTIDARTIAETVWDVTRDRTDGRDGDRWFDAQGNVFREERKSGLTHIDDIVDVDDLMTGHPLPLRQDDDYEEIRELVVTELTNIILTEEKPQLVTDGGVDDSHFEHTCAGLSADNTPCRRGVSADIRATPEYSYCNDHEWQAKFDWEDYITQILPNNQTKRIHVTDVNKTETEWGPVLEIETQYGSVRVSSDEQIESGCVYDMTVKRSRTDWNQLVLYVKQVEDDD